MKTNKLTIVVLFGLIIGCESALAHDLSESQSEKNSTCDSLIYDFTSEVHTSATKDPITTNAILEKKPILNNSEAGRLFKYSLQNINLDGVSPAQKTALLKSIGKHLYVSYKPDGSVHELYGYKNTPLWDYNALKSIILTLQVIFPQTETLSQRYQIEEQDDKGIVLAEYETVSNQVLNKHRRSYKTLWNEGAAINLENSKIIIQLTDGGNIQSINMQERISIGSKEKPLLSSDNFLQLTLRETRRTSLLADDSCTYASLADALEKEQLILLPVANVVNTDILREQKLRQLANVNFDDLIAKLRSTDDQETHNSAAVVATLIDFFTYYPERLEKVPDLLEQYATDSHFTSYLIASTAHAKTTESSKVLLDIMKRFNNHSDILMQAILAHHSILLPSSTNAEHLISLYQSSDEPQLKTVILLAIGSLAGRLDATKNAELPHPTTDFIIGEALNSPQYSTRSVAISAIGNSRDIHAFPALRKIIETEQNPDLIGKAINAIKQMPAVTVNPLLAEMLNDNQDHTNATLSALLAFQKRGLNDEGAIQTILNGYPAYREAIKLQALVLLLEQQIASKPMVSNFIANLRQSDTTSEAEIEIINKHFE